MLHFVYIVRCKDDTYYTGYTNNIEKRIKVHNSGKGAKYTRGRIPVELLYCEEFLSENEARKREIAIKKLSRGEKEGLISGESKED